jgi:hypothetical protein
MGYVMYSTVRTTTRRRTRCRTRSEWVRGGSRQGVAGSDREVFLARLLTYLFQAIIYGLMFRGPKLVFTRPQTAVDKQSISAMRALQIGRTSQRRTGVLLSVSIGRRYRRPGFGS